MSKKYEFTEGGMARTLIQIQNMIYEIRGQKVMLDSDLAGLYGVELRSLNQAVKRNIGRFPSDFMFQLTDEEWANLRSQIVIFNKDTRKYKPYAFSEQGVSMLSSIINSERAIGVNINIMRAFVKLRHYVLAKSDTNDQIAELRKLLMIYIENTDYKFSKQEKTIEQIIIALNNLIEKPPETKPIGFNA
ncbi:MAG: ORF6N domain-containing protein [Treponema sp.]|nr:ORF6N domain-containing protein [Treponema sp.]